MKKVPSIKTVFTRYLAVLFFCCVHVFVAQSAIADTTADSQAVNDPTPQPPVIDAQPKPDYEPNRQTDISTDKTAITPTPQPPLNDAQQEPGIVETNDSAVEQNIDQQESENTTEPSSAEKASEKQATSWLDTRPKHINADWLQLSSGEWLRGHVISMQKNSLEFNSDELKNLSLDWKKVKYLKSHEPFSLRFDNHVTAIGSIEITQDKVFVNTDYDEQEFDRNTLLIIASGRDTELSLWSSKITLGLNIRRGNTNQTDYTAIINAKRRSLLSRLVLDYLGNFTKVKNTQTINNHRLNGTYDIFITRYFFWTLLSTEYFRDPFQNVDRRINSYTALGYTLINNNDTEWDISAGPGYQETRYLSVQQGSTIDSAFVLVLSTKFETALNSRVDLEGTYIATIGDSRTGNYTHHSLLTIETEITGRLDFDVTMIWDRTAKPVPDENDIAPERDDLKFLIGIGYEL